MSEPTGFVVRYDVAHFGVQVSGPYATLSLAEEHARDIAGYEGVLWAIVEEASGSAEVGAK